MKKFLCCLGSLLLVATLLSGCSTKEDAVKIGVSFGVGSASRWPQEQGYMEERAKELGDEIEVRLNTTDTPKTQQEDCFEMIDSGIDVLILTPRDVNNTEEILAYAKKKNVKVVNYARVVLGDNVDLFVGYDSGRIGQSMGQYLSEKVYEGDYIILRGDSGDYNATLLYEGAMRYIDSIRGSINILMDEAVPGWSADTAKEMVKNAVAQNGNRVNAILAPNDKLAGACADALTELGVTTPVVITGMDAELDAVKRIVGGRQDMTVYMDLKDLARKAVEEADKMGRNQEVDVNADFNNQGESTVASYLINGQVVTKQNIDKILIDKGYYTKEEVYGN